MLWMGLLCGCFYLIAMFVSLILDGWLVDLYCCL